MKAFFGLLLIILGIAIGAYVDGYLMFVRSILSIIEQIQAPTIDASIIAWSIIKILLSSLVGSFVASIFILPGYSFLEK